MGILEDHLGGPAQDSLVRLGEDGDILSGNNIDLIQLSSGCLCCTLKGSLLAAVHELADKEPLDHIGGRWRLDRLVSSTQGMADEALVGMFTLMYRRGDERHRVTLQASAIVISRGDRNIDLGACQTRPLGGR